MKKLCLFLLLFVLWIPSVTAQYDGSNLLDMLATVPDTFDNRESFISYVDFRAMEVARDGIVTPDSWIDFMSSTQTLEGGLYMAALRGIQSGPGFLINIFGGGELWEETIGFDFFDIDRTLTFGTLPAQADVLVGEFDREAIASAFTARGFTSETLGEFDLWCGAVGCENGMKIDIQNRNLGNPFGGDLGQSQPILISDNMIVSSRILPILQEAQRSIADESSSLADNPTYIAAVNSINPDNIVIQASFVYFTQIVPNIIVDVNNSDTEELEQLMAEFSNLPQYELVMIADTATDSEQVVYVTLVYSALDDAETAIEVIPDRLVSMDSILVERPFQDLLNDRGVTEIKMTAVLDDATDKALAIFEFRAPLASSAEDDQDAVMGFVASSMIYQLFNQMIIARDTDWLVTGMGDS